MTLQSAHLADTAALYDACGLPDEGPLPEQTLLCAVTVCRGGAKDEDAGERDWESAGDAMDGIAPLRCWTAAFEGWGNVVDTGPLFEALNPGAPLPEQLPTGAQQSYLVPVALWQASFSPRHWQRLGESDFRLQLSVYPVAREFHFTPAPLPASCTPAQCAI